MMYHSGNRAWPHLEFRSTGASEQRSHHWGGDRIAMRFGDCLQRFCQRLSAETVVFPLRRGVVALHDKRRGAINHEALDAAGDALERVLRQRLFAIKDGQRRDRPVDTFRRGAPWRQPASLNRW